MDVVNPPSGVFPGAGQSRETVGAELRPAGVASPDLAAADTQNPPVADGPVSISQPPKYEVAPSQIDGVRTIAEQPKYEIQPDTASPATQGVDLGAPVAIDGAAQPVPPAQESVPDGATNDISHLDAVDNSLNDGKHESLEDMVAQPPTAPVLEDENKNIGDVSAADAISPAASVAEAPLTAKQPPAPIATPAVAQPTAEAVPPPFVVTPEDDGEQQAGDAAAVPSENPVAAPDSQSVESQVVNPGDLVSPIVSPEPTQSPVTADPVQPVSVPQPTEAVSETPAYTPTAPIATEPVNLAPATMEVPPTAEEERATRVLDLFDQRIGDLRAELEKEMGGPAEEEKSKGEI